ncbi:hypothetical protein D3C75_977050 [compost metagenome]
MGFNPISGQYQRSLKCELRRKTAGVMGNYYRRSAFTGMLLKDIISEALSCSAHSIPVDPVAACSYNPAQAACAELQISVKTLFQLLWLIRKQIQFCLRVLVNGWVLQPA